MNAFSIDAKIGSFVQGILTTYNFLRLKEIPTKELIKYATYQWNRLMLDNKETAFSDYQKEIYILGVLGILDENIKFEGETEHAPMIIPVYTWEEKINNNVTATYKYKFPPIEN